MTETTDGRPSLQSFYLTFGTQYHYEAHPHWAGVNPDGWVRIEAADEGRARGLVFLHFDSNWSMLCPEQYFRREYFPAGELAVIRVGQAQSFVGIQLHPIEDVSSHDPRYHGVMAATQVAHRIEGIFKDNPGTDPDAVYVHPECAEDGAALFARIDEVDPDVQAFELDWAVPYECPICKASLT